MARVAWLNGPSGSGSNVGGAAGMVLDRAECALTIMAITVEIDFRNPVPFLDVDAFREIPNRPLDEQKRIYADRAWRARAKAQLGEGHKVLGATWMNCIVLRNKNETLTPLLFKSVSEIARERGGDPFNVMLDIALEDNLELKLLGESVNNDHRKLGRHIKDPRLLLGLHDAGAHVDMLYQAGFPTYMYGHWVREEGAIELEHAVRRLTSELADYFGLKDRGRVAAGKIADLMVFDPAVVGSAQPADTILDDLPAGGVRLHSKSKGMAYTIVNGQVLIERGEHTGVLPGKIIEG